MIDISGPKVSIPTALFILLSPGLISGKTSRNDVYIRSLILLLLYKIMAIPANVSLTRTDLIDPTILFILLSPGMMITLPAGSKGLFMSGQTNISAIFTHALIFAIVFALLRKTFPLYY